jgi:nucleoside-diphosphate-sugar epimerase
MTVAGNVHDGKPSAEEVPGTDVPVIDLVAEWSMSGEHDPSAVEHAVVDRTREFLAEATVRGATHVVVVTSAMVYGAWDNNPVPLDESRPVRPQPRFALASALAVAEVMVEQWRSERSGRATTILRPAPVVSDADTDLLVRALAHAAGLSASELPAPAQFLHRRDLESAVDVCRENRADGIFNVAPDGSISGERLRELVAHPLRPSLPPRFRDAVYGLRWFLTRGPIPPGLIDYVRNPWVVSNEALRSLGWEPTVTNEQAYVAGTEDDWYSSLSARRRQELALAGAAVALVAGLAAVSAWWRRRRRRRADD